MDHKEQIKRYFDIEEVVCPHVCNNPSLRALAWDFFDPRLIETMYVIRENLGKAIHVNNWATGGSLSQRGLRCNVCALVREKTMLEKPYISTHLQGTGIDFDVKGMSAQQVRDWIVGNQDILPYPIRLEDKVTWVHLDVRNDGKRGKVLMFES